MTGVETLRAAVARELPEVRAGLERLVRIPSVSADPGAAHHVRASADETAAQLVAAGMPDVEVLQVEGGQPAVLARRSAPTGAPTVLLYAHHDVQPPGSLEAWHSDPFEPVQRDGRLFGRGCADDKAGIAVHCAALRALGNDLAVGVTVLVEGEEETGSPTLPAFLDTYRDRLAADAFVLADSTNWRVGVPALTVSLRGGVNVVVEVATIDHPLHNGVYGGPVPDALTVLARLIATLHDANGDVAVEGLAREPAGTVDLDVETLRSDAGLLDGVELIGTGSLASRLWSAPAISVIGIEAPAVDSAPMTLVPRARAKITLRSAPGDDPGKARDALVDHLHRHVSWGARLTVTPGKVVTGFRARSNGPARAALVRALGDAWGTEPVDIGVGGSIDFVAAFARSFPGSEILVTGVEDPDTRAHGPNESLHLADFERACLAEALFLARLSGAPAQAR